ncbi:hypothetical protein IFM89_030604 [Coptis chinensis]|uniref:Uncharacterized protein n=1 Tax=Coptis chinensis TaxID=261450 RepID=A0A835HN66_9MAGN|nr:hypothetical protein IFM89_030604 [Coptis chinensis]
MGEDPAFLELTGALNPEFKPIPCRTVINVLLKFFREERPILKKILQAIPGKICLSSNLWTSNNERRYMCITAHFVDSDWKLNKKIISFPMLEDESFNMISTFEGIYNSISRWSLNEKIFTVSLDNALSSDVAERLKEALFSNASGLGKQLFCVSCGTHIFNIIVQEGLNGFRHSLKCIRKTLIHIESCADVQQKYRELCKTEGIDFKKITSRLSTSLEYHFSHVGCSSTISKDLNWRLSDSSYEYIPTVLDWKNAAIMRDILKVFYESTKLCSRSKYVSSSSFFHQLSNICLVLSKYKTDPSYASIIGSMKSKITKCLCEIPVALGLATCMDPRYKVSYLEVCFEIIYGYEETHRPGGSLEVVRIALKELYDEYEQKLVGSLPMESTVAQEDDPTFAIFATRNRASSQSNASELQSYLDQPSLVTSNRETFDVLGWWKTQQINYPILSSMARDLLTIPISVPIDAAFTTSACRH